MKGMDFGIWILFYSEYVLKNMVVSKKITPPGFTKEHYNNWLKLLRACRIIIQPSISIKQAKKAHDFFKAFLQGYQALFGEGAIKPNHHILLHILDNCKCYGSVYSFSSSFRSTYLLSDIQGRIAFYTLSSIDFTESDMVVTGSEPLYPLGGSKKATDFDSIKDTASSDKHFALLVEFYSICYKQDFTETFHLSTSTVTFVENWSKNQKHSKVIYYIAVN